MRHVIFVCLALPLFTFTAVAQVKIHVPQEHQKKYERIHASVENTGTKPVSFCIEVGRTSPKGNGQTEGSPSPFWVQNYNHGKWGTLIIGPDVASGKSGEVLDPGRSLDFSFRLADSGQMRLRMNYWNGSFPHLDCHIPPNGTRLVTSAAFSVE